MLRKSTVSLVQFCVIIASKIQVLMIEWLSFMRLFFFTEVIDVELLYSILMYLCCVQYACSVFYYLVCKDCLQNVLGVFIRIAVFVYGVNFFSKSRSKHSPGLSHMYFLAVMAFLLMYVAQRARYCFNYDVYINNDIIRHNTVVQTRNQHLNSTHQSDEINKYSTESKYGEYSC